MKIPYYKCKICGEVVHTAQCYRHMFNKHPEIDFWSSVFYDYFELDHNKIWTRKTGLYREDGKVM